MPGFLDSVKDLTSGVLDFISGTEKGKTGISYQADSTRAAKSFSQNEETNYNNTPLLGFEYYARVNFNPLAIENVPDFVCRISMLCFLNHEYITFYLWFVLRILLSYKPDAFV